MGVSTQGMNVVHKAQSVLTKDKTTPGETVETRQVQITGEQART